MDRPLGLPRDGAIAAWFADNPEILRIEDVAANPHLQAMSRDESATLDELGASLIIPMVVKGSLTGLTIVGSKLVSSGYTAEDFRFLGTAADQMAIALENARLYAATQRVAVERTALAELGLVVNSTLDLHRVFEICEEQVRSLISCGRFVTSFVDEDLGELRDAFVRGTEVPGWPEGNRHPMIGSPSEKVIQHSRGTVLSTSRNLPAHDAYPAMMASRAAGLNSTLIVPLISGTDVIGTMNLKSRSVDAYDDQDLALAGRVAAQISTAIANSRHYEQTLLLLKEREERTRFDLENRELQRMNDAKTKFLSTVSHELRTPLTSMLAFTEILTRNKQGNLVESQMEYLNILDRNGRHLNVLIGDLLDVSRVDAGTLILEHSDFDAAGLLDELARSFEPLLEMKAQTLEIEVADGPMSVSADWERMAQVISNLLSNASKYTPDGGAIGVELWDEADELDFRIRDNGIGISEDDQKQLFTSFFRADNEATRAVPGTGLGLVVVKGIINQHGGDITVESEAGEGTTFAFHIRRSPVGLATHEVPGDPESTAPSEQNGHARAA